MIHASATTRLESCPPSGFLWECLAPRGRPIRMSLPVAHALVGASISVTLWPQRAPEQLRRAALVGALLGVCPDADYLLSRFHVLGWGWHHGFTHSIAF